MNWTNAISSAWRTRQVAAALMCGFVSLSVSCTSLTMTKLKFIPILVVALAGVMASLRIRNQSQVKLRENDAVLGQQDKRLAELAAEHQRLSNPVVQATSPTTNDHKAELAKLRKESEAFRKQTSELGKQLAG